MLDAVLICWWFFAWLVKIMSWTNKSEAEQRRGLMITGGKVYETKVLKCEATTVKSYLGPIVWELLPHPAETQGLKELMDL